MKYFAIIDGEQHGPFTLDELIAEGIRPDTYVWSKEMRDWQKAEEVAEICRAYRTHLYDVMHPHLPSNEELEEQERRKEEERNRKLESVPRSYRGFIKNPDTEIGDPIDETPDYSVKPRSMLPEAILATILCCPLTGIIAIVMSIRTNQLWKQGKDKEAYTASRMAKMWIGITLFMGFIMFAIVGQNIVR